MRKLTAGAIGAALLAAISASAQAAEGVAITTRDWQFNGIFGTFDRAALQRGLQVYREVCAGCHSLDYIAFRNLADLGYNEDEIKALAAEYTVVDGPNEDGEMFERSGRPSDYFPAPFANSKAAAAANGGAVPPDLSLMAKARKGGPNYTHALLIGYEELPENHKELPEYAYLPKDFELTEGLNFNKYFPGHQIAMAQPLYEDGVEYADGTAATVDQMAADVAHFLMWTAEPKMEVRKYWGQVSVIILLVLTAFLYAAKKQIWRDVH